VPEDRKLYRGWVAVRDYLRAHPGEVRGYDAVKPLPAATAQTLLATYTAARKRPGQAPA
jgi:GrpB-like predicted nucleotidyltransferase (UPF0157 family)